MSNIEDTGYTVMSRLLSTTLYGVPQTRERTFFIGVSNAKMKDGALRALSDDFVDPEYDLFRVPTHKK